LFANISNHLWYARQPPAPCSKADFTISSINRNGQCITRLKAVAASGNFSWEIYDLGKTYTYANLREIELPNYSSPNAQVSLTNGNGCELTRKLSDDKEYLKAKQACASGGSMPQATISPALYPNPSSGYFRCMNNGSSLTADQVWILNAQGNKVAEFENVTQFNIIHMPAGVYWYKMLVNGNGFTGKLVKL
jgi:Secretion system C-terminal sorting domain